MRTKRSGAHRDSARGPVGGALAVPSRAGVNFFSFACIQRGKDALYSVQSRGSPWTRTHAEEGSMAKAKKKVAKKPAKKAAKKTAKKKKAVKKTKKAKKAKKAKK